MNTGFEELDKIIDLDKAKLITIAGRPVIGKTTLALNILMDIVFNQNIPALMFSLELSKGEIERRILTNRTQIEYYKMKAYRIIKEDLDRGITTSKNVIDINTMKPLYLTNEEKKLIEFEENLIHNSQLYIDDTANMTINYIYEKARQFKEEKDIGFILIDYIQLISCLEETKSNKEKASKISSVLKVLSLELDIPIIVVSQLSRKPEEREEHRPILNDFTEYNSLVKNSDIIMLIYRDFYYNINTEDKNIFEVTIAKNNNGKIKTVKLKSKLECYKIEDI